MAVKPRHTQPKHVQEDEGRAMLQNPEYPPAVRQALLLCLKGARLPPQRCLVCSRRSKAMKQQVYIPDGLMAPVPDPQAQCTRYLLCEACYSQGVDIAVIEAKLRRKSLKC